MRILHITESDGSGAVGRLVLSLHQEQKKLGHASEVLTLRKHATEEADILVPGEENAWPSPALEMLQQREFDENPAHVLCSFFTLGYPGLSLLDHPAVRAADVIHLHDVKHFLSPMTIRDLSRVHAGKMVWSLSDAWAFTGGCQSPNYCAKFASDCQECPQLHEDRLHLPAKILSDKTANFKGLDLLVTTPNQWFLDQVGKSTVLREIPSKTLTPAFPRRGGGSAGKQEARKQLGIAENTFLLVLQCEMTGHEMRAHHSVRDLVEASAKYNTFKRLAKDNKLQIVTLGLTEPVENSALPVQMWNVDSLSRRELLLHAADLLVLPRVEENTVEAVLESMSFGTPVAAFDSMGIGEYIRGSKIGLLIPTWDIQRMAEEICMLSLYPAKLADMSESCRAFMATQMDPAEHARQMLEIYSSAASAPCAVSASTPALPRFLFEIAEELHAAAPTQKPKKEARADDAAERLRKVVEASVGKLKVMEARFERYAKSARSGEASDFKKAFTSLQKLRGTLAKNLARHESLRLLEPNPVVITATKEGGAVKQTGTRILPVRKDLRDPLIQSLPLESPPPLFLEAWIGRPLASQKEWIKDKGLGSLNQYPAQPLRFEAFPKPKRGQRNLPTIAIVTPSFMQGHFIERTIASVLDQNYPNLRYAVQDAGSNDETVAILKKHEARITVWNSTPDTGQARAIREGFAKIGGDIMAWLNSDDTLMPGTLRYVADYFLAHPEVDALYGHRVIIDENDDEVARWVLPPHDPQLLGLIDYVPQETLFWRAEISKKVGGIDPKFRFAMDWDFLLRLSEAGAKIVRVPYFLGCFRVHSEQKTSAVMDTIGAEEVSYLRLRTHGELPSWEELSHCHKNARHRSAIYEFLLKVGIRL